MKPQEDGWMIDERESQILGSAARKALNVNFFMGLAAAAVLMMLGWVAFVLLAVIGAVIPHLVFNQQSKKAGVDVYLVAGRHGNEFWWKIAAYVSIFILVLSGAAAYAGIGGEPLIPGIFSAEITDNMTSFLKGFAGGGLVGGVIGLLAALFAAKKAVKDNESDDDEEL